jgi:protein SCO1/2
MRSMVTAVLGVGVLLAAVSSLGAATPPVETIRDAPAITQDEALRLSQSAIGRQVGNYTLTNADGQPVRLSSLRGKPVLVSFIYTGCFQVCPTTTRNLKQAVESAQRSMGLDSFHVISVGFNLPADTPQAMASFARQQGVFLPNWKFLSPDADTLAALAEDLGFTYSGVAGGFDHITQVSVLDQEGRVYRQVYGDSFPLPQLVQPLKELLTGVARPQEGLAGFIERVRILCTVYDPASGTYRYNTSILFEIAGGLVGISAMLIFLVREGRKTRRARAAH